MQKKITKNYMPEIPQYGFGGWLQENAGAIGSVVGGTLGSILLPGVGTALGASLGGALGGNVQNNYTADQQATASKKAEAEQLKSMRSAFSTISPKSMYGIYAKGGSVEGEINPIINIEKGELAIQRPAENSRLGKIVKEFTGKNPLTGTDYEPHAKVKTKEAVGNYVPTEMVKDDLKADYIISKKYAKQYKDAAKRKDKYTLNSILRNIDAETEMGKDERNSQMKKGGPIPKYDIGGSLLNAYSNPFTPPKIQLDPWTQNLLSLGRNPMFQASPNNGLPELKTSSVVPQVGTTFGSKAPVKAPREIDGITQNALLASVPGAINLARGLFEKPVKEKMVSPIFNPYEQQALSKFSGRISSQPAINELNTQRGYAINSLKEASPNSSVYRSNLQNIFGNSSKAAGSLINQTRQANLGLDAQEGQALMGAGAARANSLEQARATNLQLRQLNNQSQAAKENLLYQGLGDIPKQQLQLNQNRQAQDMEAFKMMMLMDTFGTAQDMYNQPKYAKYRKLLGI